MMRLGCCARGLPSKVTCGRATKTHAENSLFCNSSGSGTSLLLMVFDCGFCSMLIDVFFCFERDSSTVSFSLLCSHMKMSSCWIVLASHIVGVLVVPEVLYAGRRHRRIRVLFELPHLLSSPRLLSCAEISLERERWTVMRQVCFQERQQSLFWPVK